MLLAQDYQCLQKPNNAFIRLAFPCNLVVTPETTLPNCWLVRSPKAVVCDWSSDWSQQRLFVWVDWWHRKAVNVVIVDRSLSLVGSVRWDRTGDNRWLLGHMWQL